MAFMLDICDINDQVQMGGPAFAFPAPESSQLLLASQLHIKGVLVCSTNLQILLFDGNTLTGT